MKKSWKRKKIDAFTFLSKLEVSEDVVESRLSREVEGDILSKIRRKNNTVKNC